MKFAADFLRFVNFHHRFSIVVAPPNGRSAESLVHCKAQIVKTASKSVHNWRRYPSSNWYKIEKKRGSIFGAIVAPSDATEKNLNVKVKVKVRTLDIAPLRETPPQKRSGTDHTVLPTNFTVQRLVM